MSLSTVLQLLGKFAPDVAKVIQEYGLQKLRTNDLLVALLALNLQEITNEENILEELKCIRTEAIIKGRHNS